MGEIADMMIEGTLDFYTEEYLDGKSPGYPRTHKKGKIKSVHTKSVKRSDYITRDWKSMTPSERKITSIRKEINELISSGKNLIS